MIKQLLIAFLLFGRIILTGQISVEDPRKIVSVNANSDGQIRWTSAGETTKLPYVIEQFRWSKWIKIGEVNGVGLQGPNIYTFKAIPYNGDNLCRIRPTGSAAEGKEVKWINTGMPKVLFSLNKKAVKIEFNDGQSHPTETLYEIIDNSGTLVKKGWGQSVSLDNLPKGKYTLNYDNTTAEIKL